MVIYGETGKKVKDTAIENLRKGVVNSTISVLTYAKDSIKIPINIKSIGDNETNCVEELKKRIIDVELLKHMLYELEEDDMYSYDYDTLYCMANETLLRRWLGKCVGKLTEYGMFDAQQSDNSNEIYSIPRDVVRRYKEQNALYYDMYFSEAMDYELCAAPTDGHKLEEVKELLKDIVEYKESFDDMEFCDVLVIEQ